MASKIVKISPFYLIYLLKLVLLGNIMARSKKPSIDISNLKIQEYSMYDKYKLQKLLNEYRREYLAYVYKTCFRSWFTYITIGVLMSVSLIFINHSAVAVFLPPLLVTCLLMYRVNKYKRLFRTFNIYDIENMCLESESSIRKKTKGVYLCYSEDEALIGYCVYLKDTNNLETVTVKEFFIMKECRRQYVAKTFMENLCKKHFINFGYKKLNFILSSFHQNATEFCSKNVDLVKKQSSWIGFTFLPGVCDERVSYVLNFNRII